MNDESNQQHSESETKSLLNDSRLSIIAVVLSVAALLTSIIEVNFVRQELRSEAWPYIAIYPGYNAEGFSISMENKGVGPARIRNLSIYLNGELVTDLDQAIIDTVGKENAFSYDLYRANNPAPGVMSSGEVTNLFAVPWEPRTRLLTEKWSNNIDIKSCYCSIYDDCWMASLGASDPIEVSRCD